MNKKELERKYGKIAIMICTKDRVTELYGLLESLRHQKYTLWDLFLLDSGSRVPIQQYYFTQYMIKRLKDEGHNVKVFRDDVAQGVSLSRQRLVDEVMEDKYPYQLMARIDDDSICDEEMLLKLVDGIDNGFDLMGCIVPPFIGSPVTREIKFIIPIIGYCELNENGKLIYMGDDCGIEYLDDEIVPTVHFRSSCIYKREIHESGVNYKSSLSRHGFLEEAVFSFKCILNGFKLGIHTGAKCLHLMTPVGGERGTTNLTQFNKEIFEKIVKQMWEEKGNFLKDYYKKFNINTTKLNIDYNSQMNLFKK